MMSTVSVNSSTEESLEVTGLSSALPDGWSIDQIAFVTRTISDENVVLTFPHPIPIQAVRVHSGSSEETRAAGGLLVLTVRGLTSVSNSATSLTEMGQLDAMQRWVNDGSEPSSAGTPVGHLMTFQGVQICWSESRIAIMASPERLDGIRSAIIEATYYETELGRIEKELGTLWPVLEGDMPLAFELNRQSIRRRKQLRERFLHILRQRAQLARIGPFVHAPHQYPPTLASQIAERLRERTRMTHRHEFLDEQLEIFQDVYDSCAQRSSDFMLARSGHTLEWIIIVILLCQSLFTVIEMLSSTGT